MTPLERQIAQEHRQLQLRLAGVTTAQLLGLWPLLNPEDLTTAPRWVSAAVRLVSDQRATSAALARNYIRQARRGSIGREPAGTIPRPGLPVEAVRTSLFVSGPVRIERARRRGLDVATAIRTAQAESTRAAARHVLNAGRETITQYARTDSRAGWARVTSGNACDFCSMLAGRGAVYAEDTVDFQAHDGCSCSSALEFR